MPDRANQWLSNWRTLCNCMLPACRWPSTYSTGGCMIWYDKEVSVVWIDTYPSRFFTLLIHFLNNAGNYNEYHICNGIWSKKTLLLCCLLLTQHKYYFWNSAAFAYSSIDLTVKQNIYYLCTSFFPSNSNSPQVWWAATVRNQQNPYVTGCLTHRSLGYVQSISKV